MPHEMSNERTRAHQSQMYSWEANSRDDGILLLA